jgi:hypothetical protein
MSPAGWDAFKRKHPKTDNRFARDADIDDDGINDAIVRNSAGQVIGVNGAVLTPNTYAEYYRDNDLLDRRAKARNAWEETYGGAFKEIRKTFKERVAKPAYTTLLQSTVQDPDAISEVKRRVPLSRVAKELLDRVLIADLDAELIQSYHIDPSRPGAKATLHRSKAFQLALETRLAGFLQEVASDATQQRRMTDMTGDFLGEAIGSWQPSEGFGKLAQQLHEYGGARRQARKSKAIGALAREAQFGDSFDPFAVWNALDPKIREASMAAWNLGLESMQTGTTKQTISQQYSPEIYRRVIDLWDLTAKVAAISSGEQGES